MATVHPSRLGLVPQSSRDPPPYRTSPPPRRSPPPSRRSPSPSRDRGRQDSVDDRRRYDDNRRRGDYDGRHNDRRPYRSRSRSRSRERRDYSQERRRRQSPTYGDYKHLSTPLPLPPAQEPPSAPWHQERNMYPNRREGGPPTSDRPYGSSSGAPSDYFEARRQQRLQNKLNIWPPSPKEPVKDLSLERSSKRRRKHKRDRSPMPSSDSESEDERERRTRRKRKEKEREREREGKRSSKDQSRERERSHKKSRTRSLSAPASDGGQWVEKASTISLIAEGSADPVSYRPHTDTRLSSADASGSEDEGLGPMPAPTVTAKTNSKKDERQYGGALLRGEGSAMAAFLQDGTDSRIPRRGEIGLTSDEIAKFEHAGYVMSGSRHRVMNAVRLRKENQVITAEEKRNILKLQQEERERREMVLREEFQELLSEKLKGAEGPRRS